MKKRLLALITCIVVVATMLSSCSLFSAKLSSVVNTEFEEETKKDIKSYMSLGTVTGDIVEYNDSIVVFKSGSTSGGYKYDVYSMSTGSYVFGVNDYVASGYGSISETYSIDAGYSSYAEHGWFLVAKTSVNNSTYTTTYSYSLYDESGKLVATERDASSVSSCADVLYFGDNVYRISDAGKISAINIGKFADAPYVDEKVGAYYYAEDDGLITVYNEELSLVTYFQVPVSADDYNWFALSGGNVLVQYTFLESDHEDKYDYIDDEGDKYTLHTYLLNVEKGKSKELKTDYIFEEDVYRRSDYEEAEWFLSDDIDNVAYAYAIEDKRVVETETVERLVIISDKGKFEQFPEIIENQGDCFPYYVAEGLWRVYDVDYNYYLLNEDGEVVEDISGISYGSYNLFEHNGVIYDWSLKSVYNLKENEASIVTHFDDSILVKKDSGETLLVSAKTSKTIVNGGDAKAYVLTYSYKGIIVVASEDYSGKSIYTVYNANGDTIATFADETFSSGCIKATADGSVLICSTRYDYATYSYVNTYYFFK